TFFPWEHVAAGRYGVGQTHQTAFRIPAGSVAYWMERLVAHGVAHESPQQRFGESVIDVTDPDGMRLALIGVAEAAEPAWQSGDIPAAHAIRGFHGVTLLLDTIAPTAAVLTDVLGFAKLGAEGAITRYAAPGT